MHLKKARVGAKTGEQERERALGAGRNGRGAYTDIMDELEGAAAEDAESKLARLRPWVKWLVILANIVNSDGRLGGVQRLKYGRAPLRL